MSDQPEPYDEPPEPTKPNKPQRTDPRQATTPLLAPWVTDDMITVTVKCLVNEITNHFGMIAYAKGREAREADALNKQVLRQAPALIKETEAFLKNIAEGF
jgi:hypothetical protein